METIINKIRSILDDRMLKAELYFDNKYTAYIGTLKKEAQLSYGYFFDLRKKNGQDYYLLDISLSIPYKDELIALFENGQKWVQKISNWDFLIQWNMKNNNALQALCILKYLDRKEDFNYLKNESIFRYKALKLPIDELENIEW